MLRKKATESCHSSNLIDYGVYIHFYIQKTTECYAEGSVGFMFSGIDFYFISLLVWKYIF